MNWNTNYHRHHVVVSLRGQNLETVSWIKELIGLDRYYIGQIYSGDFTKIWGLLRIYELYFVREQSDGSKTRLFQKEYSPIVSFMHWAIEKKKICLMICRLIFQFLIAAIFISLGMTLNVWNGYPLAIQNLVKQFNLFLTKTKIWILTKWGLANWG